MGFVSSINAENKFGESYGKETAESLGNYSKRCWFPHYVRYTSTTSKDYKDYSKVKTQITAQLLGISEPNVIYKKKYSCW
jgi:hypothetical protein